LEKIIVSTFTTLRNVQLHDNTRYIRHVITFGVVVGFNLSNEVGEARSGAELKGGEDWSRELL
jgi:hypothetical protein